MTKIVKFGEFRSRRDRDRTVDGHRVFVEGGIVRLPRRAEPQQFKAQLQGVMVALYPPTWVAARLAEYADESQEQLHLTLAYFGKAEEFDEIQLRALREGVEKFAKRASPLEARIGGSGRFQGAEHVHVALIDAPGLPSFRSVLLDEALYLAPKTDHGFTPHITLRYLEPEQPTPGELLPDLEWRFTQISCSIGGERTNYPLEGS